MLAISVGCCSTPATLPPPPLPAGKPEPIPAWVREDLAVARIDGLGRVELPESVLRWILTNRAEWVAWATALERAGRWRRPGHGQE